MSIRGSNFENQHPFASDHALVWAHCMPDGLLYGVDMSFTPTLFTLGAGFMLVAGRMFEITTAENISINPGNGYARVYATIDTAGTASENSFDQVSFGVDYAANLDSFADLTQGEININQDAALYQAEVAVLAIDNTGITTIERQMELIEPGIGGGGGAIFAVISVSYPEGSICTCSDGVKTFTAKDTSGQALFIIPYAGSWTVTATAENLGATQTITITDSDKGTLIVVTLIFSGHYYNRGTFADGIDYAPILTPSTATATAESTMYKMVSPANSNFEMYLRFGAVDLTYINELTLIYSGSVSAGDIDGCLFVSPAEVTSYVDAVAIITRTDNPSVTEATIELDVSGLSGDYYIYVGTNSRGGVWRNSRTINILEVKYG